MALVFLSKSCRAYPAYEHDSISMPKTVQEGETSLADLTCCNLYAMSMPYLHISHLAAGNVWQFPTMPAMNLF